MQPDFFTILIDKYLAGKASAEEIQLLEEYYTRMGRKEVEGYEEGIQDIRTEIFSALQSRIQGTGPAKEAPVRAIPRRWWLAAAMLATVAGTAILLLQYREKDLPTAQRIETAPQKPQPAFVVARSKKGSMLDTVLQDGTRIILNENSSITIPAGFALRERTIELKGEALFEVKHNASMPFRVKAGDDTIEDLGTKFNVDARNGKAVKVTLLSGIVTVNSVRLTPGQQYVNGKVRMTDTTSVIAWTDAILDDKTISFPGFPGETGVKLEKFMTVKDDDDKLGGLFMVDDTTLMVHVITPHRGDYFFRSYSLITKNMTGGYIPSPSGPGIWQATFPGLHRKSVAWMYDLASQTLLMTDIRKPAVPPANPVRTYNITKPYYDIQLMDNLKLIGTTDMHSMLDVLEYNIGSDLETGGYGSLSNAPDRVHPTAWRGAHQSFIFLKPTENKAVVARRFTDEIRIFDLRTRHSILIKGPENIPLEFNSLPVPGMPNTWAMERTEKTKMAFQHGAVTNEYIYLLFSGEYDEMRHNPQSKKLAAGQYLFVYDWNGHPVRKIKLGRYISTFTVTDDDAAMYASYNQMQPSIIYKAKLK